MKALARTLVVIGLGQLLADCSNVTSAAGGLAPRTGDIWYVHASHFFGLPAGGGSVWYCANPGDHPAQVGCIEAVIVEQGEPDPGSVDPGSATEERSPRDHASGGTDDAPFRPSCGDLIVGQTSPAIQVNGVAAVPSGAGGIVADGTYVLTQRESVADEAPHTHRAILRLWSGSTRFELASSIDRDSELRVSGTTSFDRDGRLHINATCPVSAALPYDRFVGTSDNSRITLVNTTLRQAATFVRWSPDHPAATTSGAAASTPAAAPTPAAIPPAPTAPTAAPETPANDPPPRRRRHHS
jgi:hypothetical protein